MDPRLRTRFEIEAIHELLPELSHYQLVGVAPEASQQDVDAAFRNESRRLHPDRLGGGVAADLKTKSNDVFRAINEAGRILRDPDQRAAYDVERKMASSANPDQVRADADKAEADKDPAKAARTPKGEKHWKMALQCWNDEDYNGCMMQINFAMQFEPNNETFKEWLAKAKEAWTQKKRGTGLGYKIRLS